MFKLLFLLYSHNFSNFFVQNGCERNDSICSVVFEEGRGYTDFQNISDTLFVFNINLNCEYRTFYRTLDAVQVPGKNLNSNDFQKRFEKMLGKKAIDVNSFEEDLCNNSNKEN